MMKKEGQMFQMKTSLFFFLIVKKKFGIFLKKKLPDN